MYVEFVEGDKFPSQGALISPNHENFSDCGWALTENDLVIDIDSLPRDTIVQMIQRFNIGTQTVWTERGVHFYFKRPKGFKWANMISPLGFPFECKHSDNTRAVTIKRNGTLRYIQNEGIREELPYFFRYRKKAYKDLRGFEEGDGRNNALFALRPHIASEVSWKCALHFINECIFASPLSVDEMEVLTRELNFEAEKDAEYLIAGQMIKDLDYLLYNGNYYFKDFDNRVDGLVPYVSNDVLLERLIWNRVGDQKSRYVEEVIKQMNGRCRVIDPDTVFKIKFKNGYLKDGEFQEFIIDEFTPYSIGLSYYPNAEPVKDVDDYINHLTDNDNDYRLFLEELLGFSFIVDPEFKRSLAKFFIFVGGGGNGKGTLLGIIRNILGNKNCSALSMEELSDERYLSTMRGKLANLGDDLLDKVIDNRAMKILKNISTCDYITSRELYKTPVTSIFTATLIFTSNHILKSWEKGDSFKRRVKWLPMFTKVKKIDPLFITKQTTEEALQYWIRLAVEGYKRLYKNGKFTDCKLIDEWNEQYHEENNHVILFLQGKDKEYFINEGRTVPTIRQEYEQWCEREGYKPMVSTFYSTVEERLGLKRGSQRIGANDFTSIFKEI